MMWRFVWVVAAGFLIESTAAKSKLVSVGLSAKWNSTPLLLEAR